MMLTENEAKQRWCPFVRLTANSDEWHTNRPSHAEVHDKNFDRCIGSACMAWRDGGESPAFKAMADELFRKHGERIAAAASDRLGFCGLAGSAP